MNTTLRVTLLTALILYLLWIFFLLKKRRLQLRYTLLWLLLGVVMFLIALFPKPFMFLMGSIGIIEPTNGLFAALLFLLLIILISMTSIISNMNTQIRMLAQKFAHCEKRVRDLEHGKDHRLPEKES